MHASTYLLGGLQTLDKVCACLEQQQVALVPTDSVYGLIAQATPHNPAYKQIFSIKQRSLSQKLPWFIADISDLNIYAQNISQQTYRLAKKFWPGALTLVVEAADCVPDEYCTIDPQTKIRTLALRIPKQDLIRQIIRHIGHPLVQTSANIHGKEAAVSYDTIDPSLFCQLGCVVDGGSCELGISSTIVNCTRSELVILRQGALSNEDLTKALS